VGTTCSWGKGKSSHCREMKDVLSEDATADIPWICIDRPAGGAGVLPWFASSWHRICPHPVSEQPLRQGNSTTYDASHVGYVWRDEPARSR